jgi:hypothetical protein
MAEPAAVSCVTAPPQPDNPTIDAASATVNIFFISVLPLKLKCEQPPIRAVSYRSQGMAQQVKSCFNLANMKRFAVDILLSYSGVLLLE